MAFIQCNFKSGMLKQETTVNILMPYVCQGRKKPPAVLYLLHGLSDDHSNWQRNTAIERYVSELNLAVVMPSVHRSFYINTKTGIRYFDFVAKELPHMLEQLFVMSHKREDTFVAGLSMGGYGAFKLALTHPERYCAAASLSGALDMNHTATTENELTADPEIMGEMKGIFGEAGIVPGDENDLFGLADKLCARDVPKPRLMQVCGTEDFLYAENQNFRGHISALDFDYTYGESQGAHTWMYWDAQIQKVLRWISSFNDTV